MHVNDPSVLREVRAAFDLYEEALLANNLDALERWLWDDDRVVRFAFGDVQVGSTAVAAARRSLPRQTGPRTLEHVTVNTFGGYVATVFAVFRVDGSGQLVHQSQTWARFDEGWLMVGAHVSA